MKARTRAGKIGLRGDGGRRPGYKREVNLRRSKGVAAVEFALVVPFLLVVMFGIVDFGFMLYDKAVLTNAAREGARAGIVLRTPRLTAEQIRDISLTYCQARMVRLSGSDECRANVNAPAEPKSLEDELRVTVEYNYDGPIVSLIGLIGGSLHLGTMRSSAVMRYE